MQSTGAIFNQQRDKPKVFVTMCCTCKNELSVGLYSVRTPECSKESVVLCILIERSAVSQMSSYALTSTSLHLYIIQLHLFVCLLLLPHQVSTKLGPSVCTGGNRVRTLV